MFNFNRFYLGIFNKYFKNRIADQFTNFLVTKMN